MNFPFQNLRVVTPRDSPAPGCTPMKELRMNERTIHGMKKNKPTLTIANEVMNLYNVFNC